MNKNFQSLIDQIHKDFPAFRMSVVDNIREVVIFFNDIAQPLATLKVVGVEQDVWGRRSFVIDLFIYKNKLKG